MPIISDNRSIEVFRMKQLDLPYLRFIPLLHAVAKGIALVFSVIVQLMSLQKFDLVMIQNPPCLPALVAVVFLQFFYRFEILLDWHNLGFAMFKDRLGEKHMLVRLARVLEKYLTSYVDFHCCVSAAMAIWLKDNFNYNVVVLHDKPPQMFKARRVSTEQRHELLLRLGLTKSKLFPLAEADEDDRATEEETIQTLAYTEGKYGQKKKIVERALIGRKPANNRVALVMSCTSWTPDEDFDMLLDALVSLEGSLRDLHEDGPELEPVRGFRRVAVVITGKGPTKPQFEEHVKLLEEQGRLGVFVAVRTAWLAPEDYPALLRCADLGVSLHTSTSGLDLPMKVLDMFGSGVPVCAVSFPTLGELVRHGDNGLAFTDAEELFEQFERLLVDPDLPAVEEGKENGKEKNKQRRQKGDKGVKDVLHELQYLKEGAEHVTCWEDNWEDVMGRRMRFILFNASPVKKPPTQ